MPIATQSRSLPRKKFFRKKKNPAKAVKEWELQKVQKSIKKLIPKPERKYNDQADNPPGTIVTTTGSVTHLSPLLHGTTDTTRIGDRVTYRSLLFRMFVTPNSTAGINYLRAVIVRDKQANASAPTMAQVFQTASIVLSPLNDDFSERFKVLYDRLFTVDTDATGAQVEKIYRKFKFVTEYDDTAAIPNTNSVYLLLLSDQATNGPSVAFWSRLRYTDA